MRSNLFVSYSAMLLLAASVSAQTPPVKPDFVIPKTENPAPAQPPANQQAVAGDQYVIGPADTLAITVVDEVDLTRKYLVESDGTITMPYIGRQRAAGLTVEALRTRI